MLSGYATVLALLAHEQKAGRLRIHPVLINNGGETLTLHARALIEAAFGCSVSNGYGCSEMISLAFQCRRGSLQLNADWALLEPVDENWKAVPAGQPSATVLLTNLANRIQPLIRYDLGDSITVSREACPCGSALPPCRGRRTHQRHAQFHSAERRVVRTGCCHDSSPTGARERSDRVERHPIPTFFLLAFGVAWLAWVLAAAESRGLLRSPVPESLAWLVGAFSPTLVAVGLTLRGEGGGGLRRLLGRLLKWRVHVAWYVFVFLWPAALSLAATGPSVLFGGATPDLSHLPFTEEYPLPPELRAIAPWTFLPLVFLQYLLISSPMERRSGGAVMPCRGCSPGCLRSPRAWCSEWSGAFGICRSLSLGDIRSRRGSSAGFCWGSSPTPCSLRGCITAPGAACSSPCSSTPRLR